MYNWQEQYETDDEEWEDETSQVFLDPETGEYFVYTSKAQVPTELFDQSGNPLVFEFEVPTLDLALVVRAILIAATLLGIFLWCVVSGVILPSPSSLVEASSVNLSQAVQTGGSDTDDQAEEGAGSMSSVSQECAVSNRFPDGVLQWCTQITHYATKRGLDPNLVAAVVWLESGGNPVAYSKSGAVGLMQVMPRDGLAASFKCVNGPCFSDRPEISELQDPEFNLNYGTKMLASLLRRHGNLRDALKSYGPMDVGYYYADKVMGIFQRYGQP